MKKMRSKKMRMKRMRTMRKEKNGWMREKNPGMMTMTMGKTKKRARKAAMVERMRITWTERKRKMVRKACRNHGGHL